MKTASLRASFIALFLFTSAALGGTLQLKGGIAYWILTTSSCPGSYLTNTSPDHFVIAQHTGVICPFSLGNQRSVHTFVLGPLPPNSDSPTTHSQSPPPPKNWSLISPLTPPDASRSTSTASGSFTMSSKGLSISKPGPTLTYLLANPISANRANPQKTQSSTESKSLNPRPPFYSSPQFSRSAFFDARPLGPQ
jgi:hypothetical protein